jgi:hypothetical protein
MIYGTRSTGHALVAGDEASPGKSADRAYKTAIADLASQASFGMQP